MRKNSRVDVIGNIRPAGIVEQMQTAYLDYSMSVISSAVRCLMCATV